MMKKLYVLSFLLFLSCLLNAQELLNESFESSSFPPSGWKIINDGGSNSWEKFDSKAYDGAACARLKYNSSQHDDWLISPQLNVKEGDNFEFWAKSHSSSYLDEFNVLLSTGSNEKADFTVVLASNKEPGVDYENFSYDLSSYAGKKVYVAVQGISTNQYYLYLDKFSGPEKYVPEEPPLALSTSVPADETAGLSKITRLTWGDSAYASGYKLYFGTDAAATNMINGQDLSKVYSFDTESLEYNSTYYWKIVPYNAFGDATNTPIWSFTVMDDPLVTSLPWNEGFEGDVFPPAGWEIIDNNSDGKTWIVSEYTKNTGDKGVQTAYASTKDELLVTPPIQVEANNFLEFFAKGSSYSSHKLDLKISETGNSYDDFTTNLLSEQLLTGSFEKITVDLSAYQGKTVYLAFAAIDSNSPYLDDVKIYMPKNMEIKTTVCSQPNTSDASIGMSNTEIMKIELTTEGKANCSNISALKFNTEGTTNVADLTGARVYFTGATDQFSTATPFGELLIAPSGEFTVSGNQSLAEGKNYFWLTYDISVDALDGNIVDASFLEASSGDVKLSSEAAQAEGSRTLKKMYRFTPGKTTCTVKTSTKFYDDGGDENNYSRNFEGIVTFVPSDPSKKIQIDFSTFDIFNTSSTGLNDMYKVYNGKTKDEANLIGSYYEQPSILKSSDASGALTVYFKVKTGNPKAGWVATVSEIVPQNMEYLSSDCMHPSTEVLAAGDQNMQMLRLEINTDHTLNSLSVSKFKLSLEGTTSAADIENAKVFYTGNSDQFSDAIEFGAFENPVGDFNISGEQNLKYGKNYFWLIYNMATMATNGNFIDGVCKAIIINDEEKQPSNTAPEGNRVVDNTYHMPKNGVYTKKVNASFNFTDDNEGIGEKYSNDANCTLTFEPVQDGEKVKLSFSDFRILIQNSSYGTKAVFRVYNGREKIANNLIYEAAYEDCLTGPEVPITSSSEDGCLTVFFVGNAYSSSQTEAGWIAKVETFIPAPMVYKGTLLTQNQEIIRPASEDQLILGCVVQTEGTLTPIESLKLTFSTNGTTSVADISQAKLYITGRKSNFELTDQIGEAVVAPDGTFSFDCNRTLVEGNNHFWLVYDLKTSAVPENVVDAECTKVDIAGVDHIIESPTLEGNRLIKKIYELESESHELVVNQFPTLFYDNGGVSDKYIKEFSGTVVFIPEDVNQKVRLEISRMDIGSMEDFFVYNGGECTDETELIQMDNDQNIGENDKPYLFKSTSDDGKLTVKFESSQWSTPQQGWEAQVQSFVPQSVYYESSSQKQIETGTVLKGEKGANMLRLAVHFKGETTPLKVETLSFSTQGTTNVSDIASAKLLYTSNSDELNPAAATQFGQIVMNPSGEMLFNGDLNVAEEETYYFWLVYDIAPSAISGNIVNADCKSIRVGGEDFVPQIAEHLSGRRIRSGFSGTYTIGESGDYSTFVDAVDAVKGGIDGPVVFNVKSGVYLEQVKLPAIQGTSNINTITFKSETGSPDDVTLIYNLYSDPGYDNPKYGVLTIEGGDFIHFENMSIKTTNKSMLALVYIRDNSTDLVFKGNKFMAPYCDSYNGVICVKSKSTNQANRNNDRLSFVNNLVSGGYNGLSLSGTGYTALPKEKGHILKGNRFENQASKALWFDNIADGTIRGNTVVNSTTTKTNFSALEIYRPKGTTLVSNNIVRLNVNMRDAKGIYLRDPQGTENNELKVINNMVTINTSSTGAIGINSSKAEFVGFYHNTVKISGTGTGNVAFYTQYPQNEINVKNNIFNNSSQGAAMRVKSADDLELSHFNYNNLYTSGDVLVKVKNTEFTNLESWKEKSQDLNSISEDVEFYSESDLHIKTVGLLNSGIAGLSVSMDIDGEERDTEHPTIGADEFQSPSTSAPVFAEAYPKLVSVNHISAKLAAKIDQNGKLYCVVLDKDAAAPTVEQVKTGTDANDSAIDAGRFISQEVFKNQEEVITLNNLSDHSGYDAYIVVEDNLANCIENALKLTFSTKHKPTEPSSFEALDENSSSFDDGTAHFEGFTVTSGEGVEASSQFARVAANTSATVSLQNTDEGLILDGFFIKSTSNVQISGKLKDGSNTSSITVLPESEWTYIDLRPLGAIVSVNFAANESAFDIDNFSGLPLPLSLDLSAELSLNEGESLQLNSSLTGGVKPYQYQWSPVEGLSGSELANPQVSPVTTTIYTVNIIDKFGEEVSGQVLVNVLSSTTKIADFEEIALEPEQFIMGDPNQKNSFFYSGSYKFNNFYAPSYTTWSGFGISNESSTDFNPSQFLAHQFRNAVGGGLDHDGNYAVLYAYGFVPEITLNNGMDEENVKGMYITNNAYTLNSIESGDAIAGEEFAQGDYYMVTVTGYDKTGARTQSKDIYLADYRSSNPEEHFILKDWEWVDLSELGKVKIVRFTVSGSRNNQLGLITPAYFCIDNFNCDKIDFAPKVNNEIANVIVDEDAETTVIDLTSLFTDSDNDDILITKKLISPINSQLLSANLSGNLLTLVYQPNSYGSEEVVIEATSNGKTVRASFQVLVNPVDDAPVVKKNLDDVVLFEDAEDFELDLNTLFTDIDNEDVQISVNLKEISKPGLLLAKIKDKKLHVSLLANAHGQADIVLEGVSNGISVETSFKVIVNSVDDKLIIANSIKNVTVLEDADKVQIDLKEIFFDVDNLDESIVKTLHSQANPDLVSCKITGDKLILDFTANAFGKDEITIQGAVNSHVASTSFKVVVEPVDDAPVLSQKMKDLELEMKAADTRIDLSPVFKDIDTEKFSYDITLSNEKLITSSMEGETLILKYKKDQYGKSLVTVKATADGKSVESSFNVSVKKPLAGPELLKEIDDQTVELGQNYITIDLSEIFACEEGEISYSVVKNSNLKLVETNFSNQELIISFILDEAGVADLTIRAEANGQAVESSFTVIVNLATGIEDLEKDEVSIYPNPCQDYFYLDMGNYNGDVQVSVINMTGRLVKQRQIHHVSTERFNMTGLPLGMYLIRIQTPEMDLVKKILKK